MSTIWIKSNGHTVETNDLAATVAAAERLGWERAPTLKPVPEPVRVTDARGLPWDGRINTANHSVNDVGSWRYKRSVTAETVAEVEQELLAALVDGA